MKYGTLGKERSNFVRCPPYSNVHQTHSRDLWAQLSCCLTGDKPEERVSKQAHGEDCSRLVSVKEAMEQCTADPRAVALQYVFPGNCCSRVEAEQLHSSEGTRKIKIFCKKMSLLRNYLTWKNHGSFEVEQQFCVDLGWFYFIFCFLKLFQIWLHFCILFSCNCSSARQWHLSLHRNSFVSAWLVDLLGFCLCFHSKAHAVFRFTHFTRGHCGGLAAVT